MCFYYMGQDKLFRAIYNDNDEEGFNVFCTNKPLFWVGQKISMQCITRLFLYNKQGLKECNVERRYSVLT